MAISALGLRVERASRVRTIVEELILESRAREPFPGADDRSHLVRICLDLVGHDVRVRVIDYRIPVESRSTHRLPSRRLASLGFVDSLRISNRGREGNLAACVVSIDESSPSAVEGVEVLDEDVEPVSAEAAAAITIRKMTLDDVGGLIRCVYRCYGYSYPDDVVYKPTVLRRMLRTGLMHSVVAVDAQNELVGHCSLTFGHPDERVPEAGRLVVDPRYRGHHLAEQLGKARNDVAIELGLPGLWSECVTNHVASQRNILALGGVETGLLIGAGPSDVVMSGLANKNDGRRTLMPFYIPIEPDRQTTIYATSGHEAMIERLTNRLGLTRDIRSSREELLGQTELSVDINVVSGVGHLHLEHAGADLITRVGDELDALVAYELGAVHVDVSLSEPWSAQAVDALEQLGFCWASFIPSEHAGGDVLRLQRVGEHLTDVQHVHCARPEGEELRDWVVGEWHRVRHGLLT